MAYKSRRDRKRAHGGATVAECPAEVRDWRHGKPVRKYKRGGHVEGEAAKHHLGKRARGGTTAWEGKKPDPESARDDHALEGREAANFPDGQDKDAQSRPEREVRMASPRKRGGRAEGGAANDNFGAKAMTPDQFDVHLRSLSGGNRKLAPVSPTSVPSPAKEQDRKRGGRAEGGPADDCPPERARGGKLTAHDRQSLPKGDFALPGKGEGPKGAGSGSYPIPDTSHARNALARVSQHGSSAEKAEVRRKVHAKYPDIGQE